MAIVETIALISTAASAATLVHALVDYFQRNTARQLEQAPEPLSGPTHVVTIADDMDLETLNARLILGSGTSSKDRTSIGLPLIGEFSLETHRFTYRAAEAKEITDDSTWVTVDPKTTLKRAMQLFGDNMLGFEKSGRRASLRLAFIEVDSSAGGARILVKKHESGIEEEGLRLTQSSRN